MYGHTIGAWVCIFSIPIFIAPLSHYTAILISLPLIAITFIHYMKRHFFYSYFHVIALALAYSLFLIAVSYIGVNIGLEIMGGCLVAAIMLHGHLKGGSNARET